MSDRRALKKVIIVIRQKGLLREAGDLEAARRTVKRQLEEKGEIAVLQTDTRFEIEVIELSEPAMVIVEEGEENNE